ncbi:unnamed protein product, partial [Notodromas monacha]
IKKGEMRVRRLEVDRRRLMIGSIVSIVVMSFLSVSVADEHPTSDEDPVTCHNNNNNNKGGCQCCLSCSDAPQAIHPSPTVYPPECFTKCTYIVTKYTAFMSRKCKCPKDLHSDQMFHSKGLTRYSGDDDVGVAEDDGPNISKRQDTSYDDILKDSAEAENSDESDVNVKFQQSKENRHKMMYVYVSLGIQILGALSYLPLLNEQGDAYDGAGAYGGYDDDAVADMTTPRTQEDDAVGTMDRHLPETEDEPVVDTEDDDEDVALDSVMSKTEAGISRGRRAFNVRKREKSSCPQNPFDVCKPRKCKARPTTCAPRTKEDEELEHILAMERQEMGLPEDPCDPSLEPTTETPCTTPPCPAKIPNRKIGPCGRLGPGYLSAYGVYAKTEYRVIYRAKNLTYEVVFPSLIEWETLDYDKYRKKRITSLVTRSGGMKSIMRAFSSVYALDAVPGDDSEYTPPCMLSSKPSTAWKRNTNETWSPDTPEAKECVIRRVSIYKFDSDNDGAAASKEKSWRNNGALGIVSQNQDHGEPDLRISFPTNSIYQRIFSSNAPESKPPAEPPSFLFPTSTKRPYQLGNPEHASPIPQMQKREQHLMVSTPAPSILLDPRQRQQDLTSKTKRSNEKAPNVEEPHLETSTVKDPFAISPALVNGMQGFDPVIMSLSDWTVPGAAGAMDLTPEMRKKMIIRRQQEYFKQYLQQWYASMTSHFMKMKQAKRQETEKQSTGTPKT